MEKTPAASAMDWSINLEKNLRSKSPAKSIEALNTIGSLLERWDSESELTAAEYRMFGLVPNEDKLFLNAIFLRLADAFRLGNKEVKNGVVKVFLGMKRRRKGRRRNGGIMSKGKLENYLEVLRRVKEVFDGGDVEERALALVLFGCWAEFAEDCAGIRYIVLSTLVSGDVHEVKAALFAAGCFCESSDDFATVFFELLTTIVISPDASREMKLAGGRAFGKMWCSSSVAAKAYKTGQKLLMESLEDDFSAVMLIALSRIASRWMLLLPIQMELLSLFLSEERSLDIQATSLKCLHFILARGVCNFASAADVVYRLFSILDRSGYPPVLQFEALRVLHKILLFNITPCMNMPELFPKLIKLVENMLHSSNRSNRIVVVTVLADLSMKLLGRADMVSGGSGSRLAVQVISLILDQVLLLVTPKRDIHQPDLSVEFEVKSLLKLLYNLVGKHLNLCCLVLNNICLFIDKLMKMLNKVLGSEKTENSELEICESVCHVKLLVELNFMLYVSKIVALCLQNLEETDTSTSQVLDALKQQLENVRCHSHFGGYIRLTYFLLLHLHAVCIWLRHTLEEFMSLGGYLSLSGVDSALQLDILTTDCANKMVGEKHYWPAYKAAKLAACHGAWSTAALIFEQLTTVVRSSSCSCWLKSLAQFSTSEKQIQLFLLHDQCSPLVPSESIICEKGGVSLKINCGNYVENLSRTGNALLSAEKILATSGTDHLFGFQRWFLTLRAKILKTAAEIMKLCDKSPLVQDVSRSVGPLHKSNLLPCTNSTQGLGSLIYLSGHISAQMSKLAQELDLFFISFVGIDRQSATIVSALASGCSLMAFAAGFALVNPSMHSLEKNGSSKFGKSNESFHALLIEDILRRFRINVEIRVHLLFLLKSFRNGESYYPSRFHTQSSNSSYEARLLHKLCEGLIRGIVTLQKKASQVPQDDAAELQIVNDGLELLLNVTLRLLSVPFRTPSRFFRVGPSVSSELFLMNEDGKRIDETSVLSGSHLSLNLCLQLKYMPPGLLGELTKVHCILACKKYSEPITEIGEFKGQPDRSIKDQEIDEMIDLNEKLLRYISGVDNHGFRSRGRADDSGTAHGYICFKINGRGQGFSTCLLDVSAFPVGSYRIKWHSGCIDDGGSYWSLLPLSSGLTFTVQNGGAL